MFSNTQPQALTGVGQPHLVDLQDGHALHEESHRERSAVDFVREHLGRQAQALKRQGLSQLSVTNTRRRHLAAK